MNEYSLKNAYLYIDNLDDSVFAIVYSDNKRKCICITEQTTFNFDASDKFEEKIFEEHAELINAMQTHYGLDGKRPTIISLPKFIRAFAPFCDIRKLIDKKYSEQEIYSFEKYTNNIIKKMFKSDNEIEISEDECTR